MRVIFVLCVCVTGCAMRTEANRADRAAVERQQKQYQAAQPVPAFDWSLERDIAIQLYQARNERVRTWTVWRSDYGMIEGHCESIGYPIPYDVQLTNPLQLDSLFGTGEPSGVVEQAEPNGLYSSKNSQATWVRSVHEGHEVPIYVECKVTCYPYPIAVDYATNRVTPAEGKPTVSLEERSK